MTMGSGSTQGFWLPGQERNDVPVFSGSEWVPKSPTQVLALFASLTASFTNLSVSGWERVGSLVIPTNVTAGDFTAERIWVPNQASSAFTGLINGYSASSTVPFVSRIDSGQAAYRALAAGTTPPTYEGIRASGTIASPTVVTTGQNLVRLAGRGFEDSSNASGEQATLQLAAAENWSHTAKGTQALITLTPIGSTTNGTYYTFTPTLLTAVDAISAGSTINAVTGYRVNGGATSGNVLRGNGTNFVDAKLSASDLSSYSVRATNSSGNQTINQGTVTAVTFATEAYDSASMHSTSSNTSRLTAPIAGRYHISGGVLWMNEAVSTTTFLLTRLTKNGTPIPGARNYFPPITSIGTNFQGQNVAIDVDMAANDYVEMEVLYDQNAATTRTLWNAECALSMHYIGSA